MAKKSNSDIKNVDTENERISGDFKIIEVSGGATMVVPATMPKFKMKSKLKKWDIIFICSMLAIPIIMMCIFFIYLNFRNIFMAFTNQEGVLSLDNFKWALNRIFDLQLTDEAGLVINRANGDLLIGLRNSLIFFAKDVLVLPFNILIAYFLYRKIKGYKFFQVVFYLPGIVSGIVMSTMYKRVCLDMINPLISSLGGQEVAFFTDKQYAIPMLLIYTLWLSWGGNMLLLGGAMARVPVEVIESARLDGIGPGREMVQIIFPLIWPTVSTLLILHLTALITTSGPILLFCPNGEGETWTIGYWLFYQLGGTSASGGGSAVTGTSPVLKEQISAVGLVLTAISVPVILFLRWLIERIPVVEY